MLKKTVKFSVIVIILLLCLGGGYLYFQHEKFYPSTNDAYIQANIVNIAPQVSGNVSRIFVVNNQSIRKGDPLFYIDPQPFEASLHQAKANLRDTEQQVKALEASVTAAKALVAQRKAELVNAIQQSKRTLILVRKKLYPAAEGDTAVRNVKVAKAAYAAALSQLAEARQKLGESGDANAQIQAAKAAVTESKINLRYTKVYAPTSGYIARFTLRKGSDVTAYQNLFTIVDNQEWWVSANFKETNLKRIKPGQSVKIKVDIYPDHTFNGKVQSISPGSGESFALLPPENATGNWVKVTQRFPVRITIPNPDPKYPLRIGASCTVTVDTLSIP